uniref:G-protein coupled receptors family 1 profile domain-containing protein n=1 Tax=Plectus sambesii TaxID=2011161 RepID=A0A914VRA0_9BILA
MPSETESIIIGLILTIGAIIVVIAYIPCLIVIYRDKELLVQSCYMMMFVLGCVELIACSLHLYVGIGTITGLFYHLPLKWNKLSGALMEFFGWHYYTVSSTALAFNRCLHMCAPNVGKVLFSRKATVCWIIGCFLYAGLWFILLTSPYGEFTYNPDIFTWEFSGEYNQTVKHIDYAQNLVNFTPTCICYAIILGAVVYKRMKYTADASETMSSREKRLFILLAISGLYPVVYDQYWHYLNDLLYTKLGLRKDFAFAWAEFMWITVTGLNPFLYLTLNQTIREKVWSLQFLSCVKNRVTPHISIRRSTKNTHEVSDRPEV